MADSKIVKQLRYTNGNASPSGDQIRAYGSGRHVDASVTPGAPEGPTKASVGLPGSVGMRARSVASPNPQVGIPSRRPGQLNVTPGMGEDSVQVRRAQNPSAIAMAANPAMHTGAPQTHGVAAAQAARVSPVVMANGFTTEQHNLLDMLLDEFIGAHAADGDKQGNPELCALARETKASLVLIPVARPEDGSRVRNGDQNQIQNGDGTRAQSNASSNGRPSRVAHATGGTQGGFNPPGDVKIFAPNSQPFETTAGRNPPTE